MKPAPSLRARLVVLVGGGLLVLLAGAFLSTALVLEERQEDMIDVLLDEQMSYSLQLYHSLGRAPSLNVPDMHFYVITPGAPTSVPAAFLHFSPGDHEAVVDGREYHLAVAEEGGRRFVLAYDVEQPENDFAELLAILGLAFGLASVAVLGGIFWLSGRALRHLELLAEAVRRGDEAPFSRAGMEAEVRALAEALDDYRARQAVLLQREQEFSGHLSHELRTPLSVVRAQAELIRLQADRDSRLGERASEIMRQADRMSALIEQLLRLARRTRAPQRSEVPLRALVTQVWNELEQTGHSRTRLVNTVPDDARVVADALLLELILRNAIANARLHADGAELQLRFHDGVLDIEDVASAPTPAPALPPEDGEGLGLAILRRACQLLGWSCTFVALPTGTRLSLQVR